MDSGLGESRQRTSPRAAEPQLRLLVELPSRSSIFFDNLGDTLFQRQAPRVWTTSPPGRFWADVFVPAGIAWERMAQSGVLHVLAVVAVVAITHLYLGMEQREVKLRPATSFRDIEISEYLPPINTGHAPVQRPRKGRPLLAKQKIMSLPPRPDNFEQTIVSPVDVKLPANVPLPNMVAWNPTVPAPPVPGNLRPKITLPQLPMNVIAPPTEARNLPTRALADSRNVIGPAPDAQALAPDRKLDVATKVIGPPPMDDAKLRTPRQIIAATPAIIPPPPQADLSRDLGEMNVARLSPVVAPKLEVAEARAIPLPPGKAGQATGRTPVAGATPAPPSVANSAGAGQLIALNLHPANPTVPIQVPPGRRSGEFAAGPEGKPNAPGTPNIEEKESAAANAGSSNTGLPAGIVIGKAPGAPPAGRSVVAGTPQKTIDRKAILMAAARPPRVGQVPPYSSSDGDGPRQPRIADKIFGGKKSYSMALNMPNLTSAGGSWIIRFAQLGDDPAAGEVTAPVATTKVDPAYPSDLMRDGIEGTVVLYAVIRKDGTVADVRVLQGLQVRLDENARLALLHWKFRPGTINGQAVDLEAVVQIPYRASRMPF